MKIGVDLDGVVFNTEMLWFTYAELYDCIELKKNSLINSQEARIQEKYDWTEDEKNSFFDKYGDIEDFDIMPGAKEVINLLKNEGHEFVVITARGSIANQEQNSSMIVRKLEQAGIKFDKYYWKQREKVDVCKKEKVDIMIDDNYNIYEALNKEKIPVIYFHSLNRKHFSDRQNLKEVTNWGEVYRYVKNWKS
ncbi:MAG: HAD family hydrolase [Clostridia bacterium]|nr:HAD family hydrolase [Clostridia bacterium]